MNIPPTRDLVEQLTAQLTEAAAPFADAVTVLTNPADAVPILQAGLCAVIVSPPVLRFPTWHETRAEWSVTITAGPSLSADHAAGWALVDQAAADLFGGGLALDKATPTAFDDLQGSRYPAYVYEFITEH